MVSTSNENLIRKLQELDGQYEQLGRQLLDPKVLSDHRQVRALSIKRAALESVVSDYRAYCRASCSYWPSSSWSLRIRFSLEALTIAVLYFPLSRR